jgi:hypothetical protein
MGNDLIDLYHDNSAEFSREFNQTEAPFEKIEAPYEKIEALFFKMEPPFF